MHIDGFQFATLGTLKMSKAYLKDYHSKTTLRSKPVK